MQSFLAIVLVTLMAVGNVAAQKQWQLVTDVNSLAVGDSVVIAASTADFALSVTQNNNNRSAVAFTKEGDILQMNENIQTFVLQAGTETGTYAFYTGSGYLFAASSSSNHLKTETTLSANSSWEITIAASGEATVVAQGPNTRNNMRFNPNNGNPIFAAYASTSTMAKVVIYKLSTTAPVAVATPILTPASGTYYTGQTVTITCATEGANIYYTLDGSAPTASSTLYTAPIAIDSTTTVKAVAIVGSDNSNVATAVYTFPAYTALANIAAFKEQTSTTELFKINSDMTVIFQTADKFHTFVQDNSAAIYVYGTMDKAYNPGDVIPGGMYGNYALYKQMNELKPVAGAPLADGVRGTEVQPVVVTLADLITNYANYEGKLVTVENVTVGADHTFQNGSASGANVSQDTNTIQIYSTFKNISKSLTANQVINVTGLVIRFNNTIEIAPRSNSDIVVPFVEVPYVLDFDTNTDDLVLANGNATNKWYIGEAQGFDNNKLYISSTNGATNKYNVSATSNVKASRGIIIPAKGAVLSFTSRVNGEEGKDMLNVYLYNYTNDIINTTPTWKTTIVGENEWTEHTFPIPAAGAGKANLVFEWVNNNNGGEQFPAAIDNIQIVEAACAQPTAINATVSTDTATITWTLSDSTQTAWTLEYKLVDHSEWYTVAATQPSVVLSGLQGSSVYDVRVKANCGDESSEWTEGQFEVGCLNGVVVMVDSTITIGTGTSTSTAYLFPGLWGWQYAAHLYDEITPGLLKDIAFYLNASSTTTGSSMKMWVKLVDAGYTMTASNTFASLVQGAREIYDGTPDFSTAGWIHFPISGNLNIPEGKSLLVLVRGIGCSVSGGCSKAYRYTSATNKVWYKNVDNADPGQEIAGTLTSYRANIQMTYSMPSVDCNDQLACETPASVTITNVTTDAATVVWTGNADSYVLEYKTGENDWTAVTINDTTYTFSNLDQKTTYTVRVKAVCGENNNSLYTDEVEFTTTSVCPVVTDINTSNLSTTTTISWTPGGNETAWTLRFRPVGTTEWVTLNISGIPSTTFGGLLDQTDYEVEIMALCDPNDEDNQSSWAPYLFTSGCAAFELPYVEEFETTEIPACWTAENFTFDGTTAQATEAGQWLMTPPITVPASGNTYVVLDIKGSASILASYRGTALNRFDVIGNIANNDEMSHVIFQVPDTYKDKAVNFMFQANGPVTIETAEFTQCAFVPTDLTAYDPTNTTVELSWIGDNNNGWVVEYAEDGSDNWTTVNVEQTSDTAHYTLTGLTGATAYKFRVRTNCAGGSTSQPSNVATITTHCDPISVPFTAFSSNADANFNCWNNYYSGTYEDNGAFVAANNDLKMYNYYNRTTDAADNTAFGNVYAVLPKFDTTLNALQITFTTEQWTSNNNSKIQLGVVTDVNHPVETFRTLNEYNAGDNAATFTYILNNATDGNLAFRLLKDSLTQEVRVRDILVEYIPACQKPNNLVATPISESSMSLNWGIIGRQNNWDIKYKATQFSYNPDNDGTLATANLRPRILNNLEYGQYYTFYIRNHCSSTEQSEWVGPFTYKLEMNYNIVNAADITTCHGNVIYQADTTGDNTLIIRPSSTGSWVTLSGNVQLGAASLKVYDGTAVNADNLIATFTGNSVVNLTPACATELTLKLENVGTTAPVINLAINCDEVPTCSAPSKPEFDIETLTLTWEAGCWGTPESYNIQMMDATTGTTTDLTSTTNSLVVSMPNDHTITFKVQPVCDGENGDWSEVSEEYVKFACGAPTAVTATYNEGAQTATITWTPFMSTQRNFEVGYKLHDAFTWVTATVTNATTYTTAALDESQTYDVRVKAICSDEESEYITTTVETPCVTIHEASGIITLGSGTSTNNYLPSYNYFNYSFSEQIYTMEEIGMSGEISSVAFFNGGSTKTRTYDVYLVHTSKSTFANGTDWVPVTEENKVFSGSVTMTNGVWTTLTFTRPFQYNGRDNLLLVVDDNSGSYSFSPHMSCRVYNAASQALRVYSDGTNYNPSSPSSYSGTVMSDKNQVQFNITGIMCDPVVSCPAPTMSDDVTVANGGATFTWTSNGTETEWTVVYTVDGGAEIVETVTTNSITLSNLEEGSNHTVSIDVYANCTSQSEGSHLDKTFFVPCANSCDLVLNLTDSYGDGWNGNSISIYQDDALLGTATISSGSSANFTYSLCSGSDISLRWTTGSYSSECSMVLTHNGVQIYSGGAPSAGEFLHFEACPYCAAPGIASVAIDPDNATVVVTVDSHPEAQTYQVVCVPTGSEPTSGTVVVANSNHQAVFNNLNLEETYDFYANVVCDATTTSEWSAPVTFTMPGCWSGCDYVISMEDSYGDGWNGSAIYILIDNEVDSYATLSSGTSGTHTLTVCEGHEVSFVWVAGSYTDEASFTITKNGDRIVNCSDGSTLESQEFLYTGYCGTPPTCLPPTNFMYSSANSTIWWTPVGTPQSYLLEYRHESESNYTSVTVLDTFYTFTSLLSNEKYYFRVSAVCDPVAGDTSAWSATYYFTSPCLPLTVTGANPYTEGFEEYTGSGETELANCWYSNGAGYTASNGVKSPFVYVGYSAAAQSGNNSLEMKGNQGLVALPEFTNDINTLSITFWANRVSTSSTDTLQIGVITDLNDPTTFVPIQTLTSVGARGNNTFVGPIEFNNVPATGRIALRYTSTSSTQSWNLDDFTVFLTPTCFVPATPTVSDVTANTAKVSWTDPKHQGNYAIEYKEQNATTWTTVTGDTTYNVVLTGLNEATAYVVRIKTVCGAGDESLYTDEVPFTTIAYPATLPYHCSFDNEAENSRWQLVNGPATNKWFTGNATGNGDNNALYISNNEGAANEYTILSAPGVVWAYRDIDVVPEYVYHLSFDWKGYGESSYDYMYVYVGDRSDVSASTSTTVTAPANTMQMVNPLKNSYYFNQNDSWATFTYELDSTFAGQKRIYFCWRNDNSVGTQPPAAVDNISIIALNKDLVAEAIKPISDNCDLSNAEVSVTVKNNTMSDTVRSFTASYQMSETAAPEDVVTETITPTAPIMPGETYTFNFATAPTFVDGSNNIYVTLNYEGDANEENNVISLLDIRQVAPASVPYVQNFSSVVLGRDAWTQGSENNNPNLWKNSNGVMTYMDNDTMAAQNYFITHCIEIPAGQMQISYDYNALSSLSESMNVYMGTTPDIASMTLIGSHTDFSKADEDYTYDYLFNNANEGVYYIAVEALSQAGNMGITFDNLKIMPIIDVTVTAGPNGTVSPLGLVKVPYNGDLTINIIPDNMYHTAGVWVDGERVMNEDPFNASFMMYTLSNITESHTINVEFKMEFHINKYAYNYDSNDPVVGGYFVPAHADTLLNPTGHMVTMIADEHYSLHSLVVGITPPASEGAIIDGTNVIDDVVYDPATRTYTYTFDTLYVSNYYVQACFKKDTVNIHYRVLTGAGIFDGVNVAAGESHDTWVNYGSDHTSTIAPADGYYTMAVTVNALNAGIIDHYDFDSIVTTQYVTAQFGHKVTASIHNLNDLSYLGSDEVRGTIAPAEQMVLSGSSCSVSGTVQEHFHLSSFLVNGVDMLSDVVFNGNAYTFTIDSLVENTDIVAEVQIDQVAIYYMVDGGNGYVNG
ncbi:MAG: fibronectin type III domain-containing protein, partial [Bacteroidales bacterium]|nr:fibronectin type III domain-containing protein [Bacteroidales bacterium]